MGKHQWLNNGNLLITACYQGKLLEVDSNGEVKWMFTNCIDKKYKGYVFEAR